MTSHTPIPSQEYSIILTSHIRNKLFLFHGRGGWDRHCWNAGAIVL